MYLTHHMPEAAHIPPALLRSLQQATGYNEAAFCAAHNEPAVPSYRINPFKNFGGISFHEQATPIPWCRHGFMLKDRPQFIFDPIFHAGGYYVQEASSMFLEQAIKQHAPDTPLSVLDLCAAPGGKSTHLLSLLPANSVLISNEAIRTRTGPLAENITKWGVNNVAVTQNDPADFGTLSNTFDIILTDAPCSGSGLFRKDAAAADEWSEANVQLCSQRQKRIVADVWPALKPGGLFIYATCSYSPEENEQVCDWLMQEFNAESLSINTEAGWGVTEIYTERKAYAYRFWPHSAKGEGFFLACFRKNDEYSEPKYFSEKRGRNNFFAPLGKNDHSRLPEWTRKDDELFLQGEYIIALPAQLTQLLQQIQPALNIRMAGCTLGKLTPKEWIPDHALAVNIRSGDATQFAGLDLDNALRFLKKVQFDPGCSEKGWYLARFKQYNLGWFKHLGNRVNNYYPAQQRILKDLPKEFL